MVIDSAVYAFESLSETERRKIFEVLERDLEMQKMEAEKLDTLRQEIQVLRKNSNQSRDSQQTDVSKRSYRVCQRCSSSLGMIFASGTLCAKCQQRVCNGCRIANGKKWMCVLCYKNREYSAITGEWFFNQSRKHQLENDYMPQSTTADHSNDQSKFISEILLDELKKAEKWRQVFSVNSIDTSDQLLLAVRNKSADEQQHYEVNLRKKQNKATKKEMSNENCKRTSWNSSHLADVVMSLTTRKNKNRLSLQVTNIEDENCSMPLHNLPIPEVKIEQDCLGDEGTVKYENKRPTNKLRTLDKLLRSPSVPAFIAPGKNDAPRFNSFRETWQEYALKSKPVISVVNDVDIVGANRNNASFILPSISVSDIFTASNTSSHEKLNVEDGWSSVSGDIGDRHHLKAPSVLSLTSLYSNAGEANAGKFEIKGRVLISLSYDCKTAILEIKIRQCEDLAAVDSKRHRSNPYVKTYLLPDRSASGKRKTKVKRHNLNPTFEETLKYSGLTKSELEERTLLVSVWHSDLFGRNDFLGEVHVKLSVYPWGSDAYGFWYELKPRKHEEKNSDDFHENRGEISLSIKYIPKSDNKSVGNSFQCLVRDARHLKSIRSSGTADTFVKAYLHPVGNKSTKQKSSVIKNDLNPVWNCAFDYEAVDLDVLKNSSLELTIWDHQRFHSNEFLGGVRLNLGSGLCNNVKVDWMDAQDKERTLWRQMIDRPNVSCDATIPLRSSMESKMG